MRAAVDRTLYASLLLRRLGAPSNQVMIVRAAIEESFYGHLALLGTVDDDMYATAEAAKRPASDIDFEPHAWECGQQVELAIEVLDVPA